MEKREGRQRRNDWLPFGAKTNDLGWNNQENSKAELEVLTITGHCENIHSLEVVFVHVLLN